MGNLLSRREYEEMINSTRDERMAWWREARFGMFIHYGLYSELAQHEWAMSMQNISVEEYERLVDSFQTKEGAIEEWIKLAKNAGMKYVVLTTRHHEGFSLWDSKVNPFNAVNYGPKRDLVREYVDACRKHDMKIGFYSSLVDWRHEDSATCAYDHHARLRFNEYIMELNRELMSNYGPIDILWYDMPQPMQDAEGWNALALNQMVRELQPHIIINDRVRMAEDFGTPEEELSEMHRDWEACMTFNGLSWGYIDSDQAMPYNYSPQQIALMLAKVSCYGGNLLLNMGPKGDGSLPEEIIQPLNLVGKWLKENGEAVYGRKEIYGRHVEPSLLRGTGNGSEQYIWSVIWPKTGELTIAGFFGAQLQEVTLLSTGEAVNFHVDEHRIILKDLPKESPDKHLNIPVFKLKFDKKPIFKRASYFPQLHQGQNLRKASASFADTIAQVPVPTTQEAKWKM